MKRTIAIISAMMFIPSIICCSRIKFDNSVMSGVELQHYLGRWYEIARIDHFFEKGINNATAMYTMKSGGDIQVINSGWKEGEFSSKTAVAKIPDKNVPAHLRVSFFRPFFSDYRILMVSDDYQYALVGGSGPDYLWILSRTPEMNEVDLSEVMHEAERRGYNVNKLIWVDQSANTGDTIRMKN